MKQVQIKYVLLLAFGLQLIQFLDLKSTLAVIPKGVTFLKFDSPMDDSVKEGLFYEAVELPINHPGVAERRNIELRSSKISSARKVWSAVHTSAEDANGDLIEVDNEGEFIDTRLDVSNFDASKEKFYFIVARIVRGMRIRIYFELKSNSIQVNPIDGETSILFAALDPDNIEDDDFVSSVTINTASVTLVKLDRNEPDLPSTPEESLNSLTIPLLIKH